jgi:hypothetical protein
VPVCEIYIKGPTEEVEKVSSWFRSHTLHAGEDFISDDRGPRLQLDKVDDTVAQIRAEQLVKGACAEIGVDPERLTIGPAPPGDTEQPGDF